VALDNLFAAVAASKDSGHHGRGGGLVDLSAVATVATTVGEGLDDSLVNSSNDKVSIKSALLLGIGVFNDSPNFTEHNDLMPDLPTDNKVSKRSINSRLSHYMEGHKIIESNHAAVKLCILSEAVIGHGILAGKYLAKYRDSLI
jgi:hypothetical protein